MNRTTSTLALLLLSSSLALPMVGCQRKEAKTATPAPKVEAAPAVEVRPAVRHTFRGLVPITGELRPIREVTLKSRVGGNVVALNFDEGDKVKKGQLIARIEANNQNAQLRGARASVSLADAQLERARADLERLQRDRARIEALYSRGAIDKKSFDDSATALRLGQVNLQVAQAQLQQAHAQRDASSVAVSETQYRAPFDGVVSRRGVSLYEYIDTFKNRDIVTIVDVSAMELVAAVPADLAGGVTAGAAVEFNVGALPDKVLKGEVIAVNPSADPRTRTVRLRTRIPNPGGLLKGGMYATGFVSVGGERQGVGVPSFAVHPDTSDDTGQRVIWRVRDGAAERVLVRTGAVDGDLTEVIGLVEGDQVVVSSPNALRPGQRVQPRLKAETQQAETKAAQRQG